MVNLNKLVTSVILGAALTGCTQYKGSGKYSCALQKSNDQMIARDGDVYIISNFDSITNRVDIRYSGLPYTEAVTAINGCYKAFGIDTIPEIASLYGQATIIIPKPIPKPYIR